MSGWWDRSCRMRLVVIQGKYWPGFILIDPGYIIFSGPFTPSQTLVSSSPSCY
jgi:hypothetical protein